MLWGAWLLPLTITRALCGAPVLACKEVSVSLEERDLGRPEVLSAIGGAPGTCCCCPLLAMDRCLPAAASSSPLAARPLFSLVQLRDPPGW